MITVMTRSDGWFTQILRRNFWLATVVMIHWAATVLIMKSLNMPYENNAIGMLMSLFGTLIPVYLMVLLLWRVGHMIFFVRPARPLWWLISDIRQVVWDRDRLADGAVTLLLLSIFFTNFSTLKTLIPHMNAYAWDHAMAHLDHVIHGGHDPWSLLMPLFGSPAALAVLDGTYVLWLFILYFVVFIACFTRSDPQTRQVFLLSFVLVWTLGGTIFATQFASVGPAFYEHFNLGNQYEPLMTHLRAANDVHPINSLNVQKMLWDGYAAGQPVSGISAFPSMHVASSVLLALYAFSHSRVFGVILGIFAAMVMVASVMLGWHYAVDGYFSVLMTIGCWKLVSTITRGMTWNQKGDAPAV